MGALSIARLRRRCALLALVLQGVRFQTAKDCLRLRALRPASERAQLCAFMRALPFLPQTDELFSDLLTTRLALTEQAERCPRIYAVAVRTGRYRLRALPDSGLTGDLTEQMLAELLRREGALDVRGLKSPRWPRFRRRRPSRTPQGVRGLKSQHRHAPKKLILVAPRKGCVD